MDQSAFLDKEFLAYNLVLEKAIGNIKKMIEIKLEN